jgi:hypothetical protein
MISMSGGVGAGAVGFSTGFAVGFVGGVQYVGFVGATQTEGVGAVVAADAGVVGVGGAMGRALGGGADTELDGVLDGRDGALAVDLLACT